jgi:hypothetical protein
MNKARKNQLDEFGYGWDIISAEQMPGLITCDVCGTPIRDVYTVRKNGITKKVGCKCVVAIKGHYHQDNERYFDKKLFKKMEKLSIPCSFSWF